MKKYLICLATTLTLAACEKEKALTPSLSEQDWSSDLDMTNPTVKSLWQDYRVGVLTNWNPSRDLLFNLQGYWNNLELTKFEEQAQIDEAFTFLNESLLSYFTNKEFVKECFPRKILLCGEVFLNATTNNLCPQTCESDWRVSEYGNNSLHSIFNEATFAMSVKLSTINFSAENRNNYMRDNMYLFLAFLFERNNLYDELGSDFYITGMEDCYGRRMSGDAAMNNGEPGVWVAEGGALDTELVPMSWYLNKGFVPTKYLNAPIDGQIRIKNGSDTRSYRFPDRKREVLTMINQLIAMSQTDWDQYPAIVQNRFAALVTRFDEWGIDIRSLNPAIEYVLPKN